MWACHLRNKDLSRNWEIFYYESNPKGHIYWYEYNYWIWKVSKVTDPNGLETLYEYDSFWRIIKEELIISGTHELKSVSYNDTSIPNSISEIIFYDTTWSNSTNTITYINGFWNKIQTKQSNGNKYITIKYEYDNRWNKIHITYPTYENVWTYTQLNIQSEKGKEFEYDVLNRVTKITDATGDIDYDYGNLDFSITNQLDQTSVYTYDTYNNLISVTEPWNIITTYNYNSKDQLIWITDADNNVRAIEYDLAGRRTIIEDLHTQNDLNFWSKQYGYDNNWNIISQTTLSGDTIGYSYDSLNRVMSENDGAMIKSYVYDAWTYAKWRLSGYTKWDFTQNYSYDIQGNIIWETKTYGSDSYSYTYQYNLAKQKISDTYPDGKITIYNYIDGIPESIYYDWWEIIGEIEYNPAKK